MGEPRGINIRVEGEMLNHYLDCRELYDDLQDTRDPTAFKMRCDQLRVCIMDPDFLKTLREKPGAASNSLVYIALGLYHKIEFKKNIHHVMRADCRLVDCSQMKIEDVMPFLKVEEKTATLLMALINANDSLVKKALFCLYCLKSECIVEQDGETWLEFVHNSVLDYYGGKYAVNKEDDASDQDRAAL